MAFGAISLALCVPVDAQRRTVADSRREALERQREQERQAALRRRPIPPRVPTASIFFCDTNDVQCRTEIHEFGIDEVRDLFVFAAWRNVTGEHTQRLRFVLPDGNTYQVIDTKFTVDPNAAGADVQAAVRTREEMAVNAPLAVAGTHITQRSLAGTWTVEVYLDGKFIARTQLIFRPRVSP